MLALKPGKQNSVETFKGMGGRESVQPHSFSHMPLISRGSGRDIRHADLQNRPICPVTRTQGRRFRIY